MLLFIPTTDVHAAITDTKIISETEITVEQAQKWAKSKGATNTFVELAELYWEYAPEHGGVNPAIAYLQAAKETGYGKFGGVLNESYKNPCGMKTSAGGSDTDPNAHQKFNTWDEGVQAQLDHLALYAGAKGYPKSKTFDPRHFSTIKGKAVTVNALGGKWAPSLTYGEEINKTYNDLLTSVGAGSKTKAEVDSSKTDSKVPTGAKATETIKKPTDNTKNISSTIGWKLEYGQWYYYKSNGTKATGWVKSNNNWYFLNSSGAMATGWLNQSGTWFFLKPNGVMQTGWLNTGGKWYYLQGDGSMATGFKIIDNKTYFLDISGAMRTGWFAIGGQWYYFNTSGEMLTGWIKPSGSWYYLHSNGVMAKGWLKLDGKVYYLNTSGSMATGWITDDDDSYYMNPGTGVMAVNTVINGWKIGADGKRGTRVPGSTVSKVIVIDAGHNFGGDDGAYATHNGVTYVERDLNMEIAVKLKSKLEGKGYTVIMTRNPQERETLDVTGSLTNRVNIANNAKADLFVSLHHNAASEAATGVEVYYSSRPQDEKFGGAYNEGRVSQSASLAASISSAISNNTGAANRGAKDGNFFVIRNTVMPSVLIEAGFITNPDEAQKLADSSYQDLAATAIANAIANAV